MVGIMKRTINMNSTLKMLGVWAAFVLAGAFPARAQVWTGPSLPGAITNYIPVPANCTNPITAPPFTMATLEQQVELLWGPGIAVDARLTRFTEPGFQGKTNGPTGGNDILIDFRDYLFTTPDCCFQRDSGGILIEVTVNQVRQTYFGYVQFVAQYDRPVANPDSFTAYKNTPTNLPVLLNDTVNFNCFRTSRIDIVTQPAYGSASVVGSDSNAVIRYVPQSNYCGTLDTNLTYRIIQGTQTSVTARVTITVANTNLYDPKAVNDNYVNTNRACMVIPANLGVLANDSDPDTTSTCGPDPLTAELVQGPSCALQFELRTDGSFTFCPCSNFCGGAWFTYRAKDEVGHVSNVATAFIGYANTLLPTANPDEYNMPDSTTLTVPAAGVLSNDMKDSCCANLTALLVSPPTPAQSFSLNSNGGFTYRPPTNFCGVVSFQYRAIACGVTSAPATVTINVNYTNQWAPVAVNDTNRPGYFVDQNTASNNTHELCIAGYPAGVLGNDRDPDWSPTCGSNLLTVCANSVVVLTPAGGTLGQELTVNSDGTFCYKPPIDYCETFKFKYRACDEERQSNEAEVWIVVNPTNQCPYRNDKPNYVFPATGLWSVISNDTTLISKTFPKYCAGTNADCLLSWVTDADWFTPNKCGETNLDWSLGVALDDMPAVGVDVEIDAYDNMTVSFNYEELFANNWGPGIEEFFMDCGVWCYSSVERLLTYYVHQGVCDDVRVDMNIDIKVADDEWDVPPPAPAIDWPGAFPISWPTPEPPIPWATEVLEDSVDNVIPTLAILVPAYEANPNNCCTEGLIWDIVGAKWKVRCDYEAFVETLFIDYWPKTNFTVKIEGVDRTFAGAGSNVTTWAGGTAKLQGEYIRYTPPANWPLCASDYDYIPYQITQVDRYLCYGINVTTTNMSMLGYIKVRVDGSCEDTVAQDDHIVVCKDADTPIPLSDLLANDYDLDFSKTNIVQFLGGAGFLGLGTNAPPAMTGPLGTNGPFTLMPYGTNWQAAASNGTVTTAIEGDTCEQDVLGFSASLVKATVGETWATWSHGYTGPVWYHDGTTLTLDLPPNTAAFAMYLSPSNAGTHQFTLQDNNGATYTTNIDRAAGAQGVAFYVGLQGDTLESITITAAAGAGGFAIGEFSISQQPVGFVHDVGFGKGPDHGQLIVTSNVTDIGVIALQLGYRPAPGYAGLDAFSYELAVLKTCGGQMVTNFETAMVTVAVGAPIANPDDLKGLIIDQGEPQMNIPAEVLLTNDTPTGFVQVIGPTNLITLPDVGTLMWNASSNQFEFKPVPGFHGCTNFSYTIGYVEDFINECTAATNTATSTFTVYVQPVNTPPVAGALTVVVTNDEWTCFNLFDELIRQRNITNEACVVMVVDPASGGYVQHGQLTWTNTGNFCYTANPNTLNLTDGFRYYLVDCGITSTCGLTAPPMTSTVQQVQILKVPVCKPPLPQSQTNVVARDGSVVVTVSALDPQETNGFGGIIAYELVQQPPSGTVEHLGGNQFRYTPNACYYNWRTNDQVRPLDSWLWRAQNACGGWATGSVSERVTFVAKAPVAVDDMTVVDRNACIMINVLSNDFDVCTDGMGTWSVVSQNDSSHGTVVVLSGGQMRYCPAKDYCGEDSFTYLVKNGTAGIDYGTVRVTVNFVDILPVAQSATYATLKDVPYSGTLQATDIDDTITCSPTSPLTYSIVQQPANGTVTLDSATGVFTYSPSNLYYNTRSNQLVKPLDTFRFVAHDGYSNSAPATISMQVNWRNYDPIANDDTYAVNENGTNLINNAFSVTLNDEDDDSPASQWTISVASGSAHGTLTVANGTNVIYAPAKCYVGIDSFSYRLSDGDGGFDEATVNITVKRAQLPVAQGQVIIAQEDTPFVGQLVGFNCEGTTLTYERATQASNGIVGIRHDGVFEYRPNANYSNRGPCVNEPLDSFTFTVKDSFGASTPATVEIVVNSANDAPDAIDDVVAVDEFSNVVIAVTANDIDGDRCTNSQWSISIVNDSAHGTLVLTNGLRVIYTPHPYYVGPDSFSYRLNDGDGGADEATVSITVNRVYVDLKINCGGSAEGDWVADYGGSATGVNGQSLVTNTIANAGTVPQKVYQSRRFGETLTYNLNVPDGLYDVRLHFAESQYPSPLFRVFDVKIEGQTVLTDFNIFSTAGGMNQAAVATFEDLPVSGGLQIQGLASVGLAQFNGIEIWSSDMPGKTKRTTPVRKRGIQALAEARPDHLPEVTASEIASESWPLAWVRGRGADWTFAPALVDGDTNTVCVGNEVSVDFGEVVSMQNLEVLFQDDPPQIIGWMGSRDLLEWNDLGLITNWPFTCRAIYLHFPDDGSSKPSAVREILWEEEEFPSAP
jgi:dTDP-4-dehydrorhamnose 3,5-epimerase-like enzyme